MFTAIRQCRCLVPLIRMQPSVRHLSNQAALMIPTCSDITIKRLGSRVSTFGPVKPPDKLTFKNVEERVIKALKAWDRFPAEKAESISLDSRFAEDLSLDSLDLVEVTMSLEDEFEFEFPVEDIDKFKSLRDVYKYICKKEDVFD
ncbi:Acyl carrier protein [Aphelenchoides bicaudatus]|nr:Acyl carrier protein [Aphelenchoides bicaudatus]